jgi:type IV pilus assembly protein PilC
MPDTYTYKVRDRAGKLVTGSLVADNEGLAVRHLREMGMTPLEIGRDRAGLKMEIHLRPGHVGLKELSVFSRQFATMINSGLPILRSLTILVDQTESQALRKTLTDVRTDVEQGSSLSGAMARHPKAFNDLYIAMIKSGETGGSLDDVLLRLAALLETEVELRRRIKSAMTYPIAVVALVSLILVAMLLFVVPQFKSIYSDLGGVLPLPTRMLLAVSDAIRTKFLFVAIAVGAIWYAFHRYKKTERGRARVDRIKLRFPVFGPLFRKTALSRFAGTLAMLLHSGVPILQALDIVADTVNNRVVAGAVEDIQASVREGESMARPMAKHAVFPPMVVQMVAVGEETGAVDTMLEKIRQFFDDEVKAAVDALTSLIEPLLIAVIGGLVGAAVIALYMPMFNIINLIK